MSKPGPWQRTAWFPAAQLLAYGKMEQLAHLLESRDEPVPVEVRRLLAAALRGADDLPFRLELKHKTGRRPELHTLRDMTMATRMAALMQDGLAYDDAALKVADELGIGERTVKAAYSKYKDVAASWVGASREMAEELATPDSGPAGAKKSGT
jgi:hypothetical protein